LKLNFAILNLGLHP